MLLKNINSPDDVKKLSYNELLRLSVELRQTIIDTVNKNGGHLASNLGVVELTIALHKVFDSPKDKIIWDVGHQGYPHKLLTGRYDKFQTLRMKDGISGFLKTDESEHDTFNAGHSSTSISAGLGIAMSNRMKGIDSHVVSVIGDGALTAGMAFEALNYAGHSNEKIIVVLNDNEMSISKNIGSISKHLASIRSNCKYYKLKHSTKQVLNNMPDVVGEVLNTSIHTIKETFKNMLISGMLFENMGFTYLGPVDGHNIYETSMYLEYAKKINTPVVVHVITKKGKGYIKAEKFPEKYHGVGKSGSKAEPDKKSFSDIFGNTMMEIVERDKNVVCFTAAMPSGTGLSEFQEKYPDNFIDVGIAEQNAITMAGGMAISGMKPVVAIYSTFLQRAYDQILHDICLQDLNVVFAIDRAGLVGNDGETHHGIYDLSYLIHMPNMNILAPKDGDELRAMLKVAIKEIKHPVAIRYPRGKSVITDKRIENPLIPELLNYGEELAIVVVGSMVDTAQQVVNILNDKGIKIKLINARVIKPIDLEYYSKHLKDISKVVTIEENTVIGGFGAYFAQSINKIHELSNINVYNIGIDDEIIQHGSQAELLEIAGLDVKSLVDRILEIYTN